MKIQHSKRQKLFSLLGAGLLLTGLALMLHSCYPGDPISASDTDVVTTFYDDNANFAGKTTYAMPDSVIYITDSGTTTGGSGTVNDQILSAINSNMQNYGYVPEADPAQADVHIVAVATKTQWTGGSCYPGYWDWWYGYPGWCYPVAYTYETGTLLIVMLDPSTASQSSNPQPIWLAGINGLLTGSSVSLTRINSTIKQAFAQSEYLKK